MGLWNNILNCTATQLSRGFLIFHREMWKERKKLSFTVSNGGPKIFLICRLELLSPYNEHVCEYVLRVSLCVWCPCLYAFLECTKTKHIHKPIRCKFCYFYLGWAFVHPIIECIHWCCCFFSAISVIVVVVVWTYMFQLIDRTSLAINIKTIDRCCSISNFGW